MREPVSSFVESETPARPDELRKARFRRAPLHETLRLHLGFLLLGGFCFAISVAALPLGLLLPRVASKRLGRRLISASTRAYLKMLTLMGACHFDLSELETLRDAPPMVIAPNHPSLLDALMVLSALPDATCIMKADIVNHIVFGAAARVAGYVRNTPLRAMVQQAMAELSQGSHVLLFPEGTRTTRFPIGHLQGTCGLIAKNAGVPVQTVFIETDSGFLGKGWQLLWTPRMPITYRVRLGKRFDAPTHSARFVEELEQYFQAELAHAQLPELPVVRPRA
ncbi:MAG: lysophospholipid acyltransferase family protein [Ramlibacter sp.]